ncbi:hypothetical protein C798_18170 [Herbaspirillum rubrisubalbicans Os34]|uniref:Uncharacterized protein n=1 Tax=Herbaspirillum rubrisubalbicans Os34 TaxID=1235827 RepID=A0A6M3ZU55_9BURK|nr:hypothetical protein [Herbaspirillum rubrisubalbicans]QJQ02086.1 hypothetical protein C798_18170 [Herbaspirillum rubrisubalbicans Os34]
MPIIFGPVNSRYAFTGSPCPHNDLAFESNAQTLGEALKAYQEHFDVSVVPCTTPIDPGDTDVKYFVFTNNKTSISSYVDIHIHRGNLEICAKQNLDFELLSNDLVELGELIC